VTIPSGATTIEGGAFSGSGVSTITIPKSVTSIGSQSWSPQIIYGYTGSQAETYATNAGYVFSALDGGSSGGDDDDNGITVRTAGSTSSTSSDKNTDSDDGISTLNVADDEDADADIDSSSDDSSSGSGSSKSKKSSTKSAGSTSGSSSGSSTSGSGSSGGSTVSTQKNTAQTGSSAGSGAYATTTSDEHTEDDTPKTGDGFDPKFMICVALLLAGMAFLFCGKRSIEQD
jgi:cobalamin biosynthesis Mg chelatase CobN